MAEIDATTKAPATSIITINFNNDCGLYDTLRSVSALSTVNYELIVIDGWSTDCSAKAMDDYDGIIDIAISEKDAGIYDAMNKGIDIASGDYVIFMNSGDLFYDHNVLNVVPLLEQHDIVYGKVVSLQNGQEWTYNDALWKGMAFSHQSAFIKRDWLTRFHFSTGMRIAADYEFFVKCETSGAVFHDCGQPIAKIDTSGVSFASFEERTIERLEICSRYYPHQHVFEYYRELLEGRGLSLPERFRSGFPSVEVEQ